MLVWLVRFLVRRAPESSAFALTWWLAAKTSRPAVLPEERVSLAGGMRLRIGPGGRLSAWSWGSGPAVVLVHGWGGRAAQMAPLAARLERAGYRAIALDVSGHGDSPGTTTAWSDFLDDPAQLADWIGGDVHAWVGHSAGGLAMMAARRAGKLKAARYVCICSPSHPYPPIDVIRKKIAPPERVIERCRDRIAAQFGLPWADLEAGRSYEGAGGDLLLFYDQGDRFVSHAEGDRIAGMAPHSTLIKSSGHGHVGVLRAPELAGAILDFLGRAGRNDGVEAPASPSTKASGAP